jgi:hypothetical protein
MVKVVVTYWVTNESGGLGSGFKKAFTLEPYPSILEQGRSAWCNYLKDAYCRGLIETDENLQNLRFYVYMVSQKPKHYQCLFPGYDRSGKVLKILNHGRVC